MPRATQADPLEIDESRAVPIGEALAAISEVVYEAIDRGEPEWPVLERLARQEGIGVLASLALALSDFQLGGGGATRYWLDVQQILDVRPALATKADVRNLMFRACETISDTMN